MAKRLGVVSGPFNGWILLADNQLALNAARVPWARGHRHRRGGPGFAAWARAWPSGGPAGRTGFPQIVAKAKRVIYLTQSGAPSHTDLFDYKPGLQAWRGKELPPSVRMGQRLTTMTAKQKLAIQPTEFKFSRHGQSGAWLSELLPGIGAAADEICFIKSMHTEAINHSPGMTLFMTGSQIPGRPSMGAWLNYGLGSVSQELPGYVVMMSRDQHGTCGQLLFDYYYGSGFLPSRLQGVKFRTTGEPVLYLSNPKGVSREVRRGLLDDLAKLNEMKFREVGDPEITTRISQYEMAYRMQMSVPELTDLSDEPDHVFDLYGKHSRTPGTYAANCILARRLAERGVRFIQLFHVGWDTHGSLSQQLRMQCDDTDMASGALIQDLRMRGLLEDTLVIWAGEFGRTPYVQGEVDSPKYGRDHHGRAFTVWMAGAGVKPGFVHGETDDFAYNVARDPVHVHDFQATILHLLGIDHEQLTFKFQGRHHRLTDVHGQVVRPVLS